MRVFLALILAPAAVLLIWFGLPSIKELMIDVVSSWGASVGLEGFTLVLANAMPIMVPAACIAIIIAGIIGMVRGGSSV